MRYHFLYNGDPYNPEELSRLSDKIDSSGYYSMLLTFHSMSPDYWIQSAAALNRSHNFKYMIAIRPYNLSYQYFSMMIEGFNNIQKNRLMINFIAGDFHNRSDEITQSDIYNDQFSIDSIEKRKIFLRDFVKNYYEYPLSTNKPEFVFSGYSDYSIETAKIFNGITLCMVDDYFSNIKLFKDIKDKMVSVIIIIRETEDEAHSWAKDNLNERQLKYSIIGDKQVVKNKILDLNKHGITDILVSNHYQNKEQKYIDLIHEVVKELSINHV
ncbi:hypothetical protein EBU71_04820 [bacterium]|nr:hypothetical protein [Candidatus Elulimicrobium humile]